MFFWKQAVSKYHFISYITQRPKFILVSWDDRWKGDELQNLKFHKLFIRVVQRIYHVHHNCSPKPKIQSDIRLISLWCTISMNRTAKRIFDGIWKFPSVVQREARNLSASGKYRISYDTRSSLNYEMADLIREAFAKFV